MVVKVFGLGELDTIMLENYLSKLNTVTRLISIVSNPIKIVVVVVVFVVVISVQKR